MRLVAHRRVRCIFSRVQLDDQIGEHDQLPGEGPETLKRRGDGDDRAQLERGGQVLWRSGAEIWDAFPTASEDRHLHVLLKDVLCLSEERYAKTSDFLPKDDYRK